MARVVIDTTTGCWEWTGSLRQGYGQIWTSVDADGNRKLLQAHRASYELTNGSIPDGLDLDQLCRNTVCVNPEHLEPVARRENILRGEAPPAVNARKIQCDEGHALVPNLDAPGRRHCPVCRPIRIGPVELTCVVCDGTFTARKRTARCCSERCRRTRRLLVAAA